MQPPPNVRQSIPVIRTQPNMVLVRHLERAYAAAIREEEAATTVKIAWSRAASSERALRRLDAARAGLPLPVSRAPRNARAKGRDAFAALAKLGRSIGRALTCAASLAKARAVVTARKIAKLARRSMRTAVRAIVALAIICAASTASAHPGHGAELSAPASPSPALAVIAMVALGVIAFAVSRTKAVRS